MKGKGRHPEKALTAVQVRSLKEPGRYADGNGLYLVVEPSGSKRWLLRIVIQGRRRDIGLGGAALVPLAEARDKALAYRKQARDGGDPIAERRKANVAIPTFTEAAEQVHSEHKASWKNAKHAAQWINTLRTYAYPALGSRRIDQVETPDVLRALSPIWLTYNVAVDKHHKLLYRLLGVALKLRSEFDSRHDWKELCAHPYWKERAERFHPKLDADDEGRTKALALFVFAGPKFVNADRASKYGRILHHAYLSGTPAESFAELIESEGRVEALLKKVRARGAPLTDDDEDDSKEQAKAAKRDKAVSDNDLPEEQEEQPYGEDEEDETSPLKCYSATLGRNLPPHHRLALPADLQQRIVDKRMICVETSVEQTLRCLELPVGERVLIEAVVGGSSGSWKRLVAKRVKPKQQLLIAEKWAQLRLRPHLP